MRDHMKHRRATTIMELVVALGIIIIGILTVVGLIARSINAGSLAKNKLLGLMYAQEGVEVARQMRDSNYLKIDSGRFLPEQWDNAFYEVSGANTNYVAIANPQYAPLGNATNLINGIWSFTFSNAGAALVLTNKQTTELQLNPADNHLYQASTLQAGYTHTIFHRVLTFEPLCDDSSVAPKLLSEIACGTVGCLSVTDLQTAQTCEHYGATKIGVHIVSQVRWGITHWIDATTKNDPNSISVSHDVYNWR